MYLFCLIELNTLSFSVQVFSQPRTLLVKYTLLSTLLPTPSHHILLRLTELLHVHVFSLLPHSPCTSACRCDLAVPIFRERNCTLLSIFDERNCTLLSISDEKSASLAMLVSCESSYTHLLHTSTLWYYFHSMVQNFLPFCAVSAHHQDN